MTKSSMDFDNEKMNLTDEEAEKQYITEKIITKRKRKWLGRLFALLFVVICAVVFGLVARVVYVVSEKKVTDLFGKAPLPTRIVVDIREKTNTPAPTPTHRVYPAITGTVPEGTPGAMPTPTPKVTKEVTPTEVPQLTPTREVVLQTPTDAPEIIPTPETTPEAEATPAIPEATPTEAPNEEKSPTPAPTEPVEETPKPTGAAEYIAFLAEVMDTAEQVVGNVTDIKVTSIGQDWLGEYEVTSYTTGLLLGQDGVDVLILTDYDTVQNAKTLEIQFSTGEKVAADIYAVDKDYGLAILNVKISKLETEFFENLNYALFGKDNDIKVGTPAVAIGRANGYENSIAIGFITSDGGSVIVRDGEVNYFTVDWPDYAGASAFVFTLDGCVCGMVTHTNKNDVNDGITSCIRVSDLKNLIARYANGKKICNFGINGCDVPDNVAEQAETESGIYVKEVIAGTPAYLAGIKNGDVIIEINDEAVTGAESLMAYLVKEEAGTVLKIKYKRRSASGIATETTEVILTEK